MTTNSLFPKRGDIWLTNFDPTMGAEIKKIRPSVVVSSNSVGKLPLKLAAPITDWKEYYAGNIWHVKIEPDIANGLTKVSAVDVLQLRGMDVQRFIRKIGEVSSIDMEEVARAIAAVVEYQ
ncbi:type II toxin-antitoxin system PemK/MazF family toxin [Planktothrix mougeotii]|uniref:mRNA interferase n=1 Tax=Planktothrix mougeotii LEGE 06226 TaxID=1828728 RepID=A0ABR9UE73_9CYAN|nr:type II toxin-antitoxin system PemK/MazF family toxin [Planktothrix mougeotii]MBE9144732.1 type II toxin-antitoxin system PemK/MazF family toxin [Planktothrix mougeotii LEGE 06226]